nr:MAG TPA_asm: hypothetical protein [Caudoviricetes sp.]
MNARYQFWQIVVIFHTNDMCKIGHFVRKKNSIVTSLSHWTSLKKKENII